jgi:hypothetical protein
VDEVDRPHYAELLRRLDEVDGWLTRIDPDVDHAQPSPGSPVRTDDARTHPYELSHGAWHSLSHAVDHLNCLRVLLRDAGVIHMYAPYSLVRSALENASTAVWTLHPASRTERVARSGITHGDLWTTIGVAERVELPGGSPTVGSFKISANIQTLMYVTTFATHTTSRGWHLYDERSRIPY